MELTSSDGEWTGNLDTTVSYGASWRATDSDPADNAKAANNPTTFPSAVSAAGGQVGRWSNNDDDPNLNYPDSGDLITNVFKITAEADIRWRNFGAFVRASGFYDFENADNDRLSDIAQDRVGRRYPSAGCLHLGRPRGG